MKRVAALLIFAGMLTTVAVTAEAGPISINLGTFSGGTGKLHAPGTLANGLTVLLGSVLVTGDLGTFESYCVDLQHYEIPGLNQVTVNTMDNWNNTALPVRPSLGDDAASWLYNTFAATATTQALDAALSLAIWNALYDNDYNVLAGTGFWASNLVCGGCGALANTMLGALQLASPSALAGSQGNALWLQTQNYGSLYSQDFIAPIPEPATLLLLGTGIAGMVGFRRRQARKRNSVPKGSNL